ncbi:hypothetical protein ACOCG7_01370 [Paraburkholderia sp. DD10]|jgi:hypothetical protein|uniref:Uncharacterized protein n=1 Tax=Paraburkholderia terricola TaxID=169427 RepID=A0A1M6NLT2_9BURK|nr:MULTISPECIES: hypothetical protein [Paraburkholderia]ORC52262.1 hypothetical protein B2G74_06560 [Burkholderia sp. A27]AXE95221.1 hypothetical protein CUJ90_23080 [Paraburkholderia terricola]MDR6410130.1 hypothetical protein [Paraburkholderia terricola]MDR6444000.1 hypothetical protein [Paraburkholderia terricola]MDR6481290.1 hypothetical protein [Paraburkholderia terricola]
MPWSSYPDINARVDLLTYLVVSQLLRHRLIGKWLTTQHVVESTHLWMHVNGELNLLQRVALASRAQELAAHVIRVSKIRFDVKALADAFADYPRLDYKSPAVVEVYSACMAHVTLSFPGKSSAT